MNFAPLCGGGEIRLGTTPKAVTAFGGLASFIAWLRDAGFHQAAAAMPWGYASPNAIPPTQTFTAFLFANIIGTARFAHCGWLRLDSRAERDSLPKAARRAGVEAPGNALHAMLGVRRFPGEDAVLRLFGRFAQGSIEAFFRPLWRWLLALVAPPKEGFTLELDSTVCNREGSREGAAKGYSPRHLIPVELAACAI